MLVLVAYRVDWIAVPSLRAKVSLRCSTDDLTEVKN